MVNNKSYLLIVISTVTVVVCLTGLISVIEGKNGPSLIQDLNELRDSNGKIVEQSLIEVESKFKDSVECYRIKYLSDELQVVGFVVRPKMEGKKFPVLIFNRGGNREYGKITEANLVYLSYLCSYGYVVLASQYRGNDGGEGKEEFGGQDVNDVLNLIPLVKSLSSADPNRIGMLGYSRGGMMTYLAIKEGAEIEAACVVGGLIDLIQTYEERESGMKKVLEELIGGPPKRKRTEYEKRSVYYWPERIDIPVLILHGEDDWRVKVTQAKKLGEKLNGLGKTYELVIYPEGDHGLNTHREERNRRIFEWFEKYLR